MASASTTELRCVICPKQPHFSDQSHLLTHIGSKGHLSHYFKAQVRSSKDLAVRDRLRAYDIWYRDQGIETLLAQRLETKESKLHKKPRRASGPKPAGSKSSVEVTNTYRDTPCPQPVLDRSFDNTDGHCIDPLLVDQGPNSVANCFKDDPDGHNDGLDSHHYLWQGSPIAAEWSSHRGYMLATAPYFDPQSAYNTWNNLFLFDHSKKDESQPEYGHNPAQSFGFHDDKTKPSGGLPMMYDSQYSTSSHSRQTSLTEVVPQATSPEPTRLKGIIWPGMDLFDTADKDLKRRRNQKKDKFALAQLAEDAEAVEPMEVIYFYPSWETKKERFISGNVESSPVREATPLLKESLASTRIPLEDLDPNVMPKERRPRGRKPFAKQSTTVQPLRTNKAAAESDDEILDLMRPSKRSRTNRKRNFKVFEDKPDLETWYSPVSVPQAHSSVLATCSSALIGPSPPTKGQLPSIDSISPRWHKGTTELTHNNPDASASHSLLLQLPCSPLPVAMSSPSVNLPQQITPQRLMLYQDEDFSRPNFGAERDSNRFLPRLHGYGTGSSPSGLSLSAILAYNSQRTPRQSPLKPIEQTFSPLKDLFGDNKPDYGTIGERTKEGTLRFGLTIEDELPFLA